MIISASRRTDIPAFYSEWFYKRVEAGFILARNPMNPKQVSRIPLDPCSVDCIVFWTKNPSNLMAHLDLLKEYKYYFQFTLTPYDKTVEVNVPDKKLLIDTFIELSRRIGNEKVIWRYDPILFSKNINKDYHFKWFEHLAQKLYPYTRKCVISFIDLYSKTTRNTKPLEICAITPEDMKETARHFSSVCRHYGLSLATCSEAIDFSEYGISHSKCIDDILIAGITGKMPDTGKDPNQRENCGCIKSVDIGAYNTCRHNCLYCYANYSQASAEKNIIRHDPASPLLCGELNGDEIIKDRIV